MGRATGQTDQSRRPCGRDDVGVPVPECQISLRAKSSAVLLLIAALVAGTGIAGPAAGTTAGTANGANPETPVVLVILDELPTANLLRDDQTIDPRRFPNIAAFASGATWYRDHAAAGDYTAWAVPPILTGNHSNDALLPTDAAQPGNIFNLLGPGRTVHAREEVTELCAETFCPDGNQGEYPEIPDASEFIRAKFRDIDIPGTLDWIDTIPAGESTLSVIHLPLPHQPLRFTPRGDTYPGGPIGFPIDASRNDWTISDPGIAFVQRRQLLQLGYADLMVRRITDRIRSNGDWDRALVILTADHGAAYDTGLDRRDVVPASVAATVNPPLIIKYPGQTVGEISRRSTQAIDILPTIARQLGVTDGYPTEGIPIDQVPENRTMTVDKDLMARLEITTSQIRQQRPGLVRQSLRRFGSGGLWRLGPSAGLIGTRTGRAPVFGRARMTLDSPNRLWFYRPRPGTYPALVSGVLRRVRTDQVAALAVNRTVVATTRTFNWKGAMRFGAMIPPGALRKGKNRIAVFAVTGRNALRRIP